MRKKILKICLVGAPDLRVKARSGKSTINIKKLSISQ